MRNYWIDADVLIRAKNEYYRFNVAPGFWDLLEEEGAKGTVGSSIVVYDEIIQGNDELAQWAREQSESFFEMPDEDVQVAVAGVGDWVRETYRDAFAAQFMAGADPWVIAHAIAGGGNVVTGEALVGKDCKWVKIPNVCREFQVRCVDTWTMLSELGARFTRIR